MAEELAAQRTDAIYKIVVFYYCRVIIVEFIIFGNIYFIKVLM